MTLMEQGNGWTVCCGQRCFEGVQAIIFDKDGTLADSMPYLAQLGQRRVDCLEARYPGAGTQVATALGMVQGWPQPDGTLAVGTRQSDVAATMAVLVALDIPRDKAREQVEQCFEQADRGMVGKAQHTPPFPGTTAMLARLSQQLRLGVLSSDSPPHVDQFLARYDLSRYFQGWLGTSAGDPPKPDPRLLRQLCASLGVVPATVLVVGDSIADQQVVARGGGAGFISVSQVWGCAPLPGADAVLTSWDDLVVR